ncbi:hypothetical protein Pelo_10834 [Pelomyxa schiedti]|nr:hypothetical protein Pelo_10834 [Pelomyxa schiedti]
MGLGASALSPEEQEAIRVKYGMPEDKFAVIIKSFKSHAGNDNRITKTAFLSILSGVMYVDLAEKIFESFDRDGSGFMELKEYLEMMGVTHGGTIDQKLEASFHLFDKDTDGRVSRDDIKDMFIMTVKQKRVARTGGSSASVILDNAAMEAIDKVIDSIFTKLDTDNSGFLDLEEFIAGFTKYRDVCGFFKQF